MPVVSSSRTAPGWRIIVPVRGGSAGKTRLTRIEGRPLSDVDRVALALAMAQDTVAAALASDCGPVWVLTADTHVAAIAVRMGASVVHDDGGGLNAELIRAARELTDAATTGRADLAFLLGDLPALRPDDLRAALAQAGSPGRGRAYVPDWEGTGTALVTIDRATGPVRLAFGPDSARRHADLGLTAVGLQLERLRCDVDTPEAWERAVALGLGPMTAAARTGVLTRDGD